jgi:TRAP-type uncharacterized transport system substrate-binding protein
LKKILVCAAALACLALSSFPAAAGTPIRLCTGSDSGNYFAAGKQIARMAGQSLSIEVVETQGTIDNLDRTLNLDVAADGACDAMIGQPDGPVYLSRSTPGAARSLRQVGDLHREYLHVLCSADSGVDDLGDLSGSTKHSVAIGEEGSGAWLIWQNFVAEDDSYGKIPVSNEGGIVALSAVASDITTCMLVPAGLGNGTMMTADGSYAGSVVLADANDKDFNDAKDIRGKPLYEYVDIPSKTYRNLQTGMFGSAVSTVSWRAGVYVNTDRLKDQKVLSSFIQAVARATPSITAEFGK